MTLLEKAMTIIDKDADSIRHDLCPADIPELNDEAHTNECNSHECRKCWDREYNASDAPTIKDSGNRREFGTGAVRDMAEGKGRMDLLPWAAIMEVSKHCENGAKKYGEHNVDKGIPTHSLCDSAARHLAKYLDGQTDESHLLAAVWNLLWAVEMTVKHPELVDTPWKGGDV